MQSNAEALLERFQIYDGTFFQKYLTAKSRFLLHFRKSTASWMFDRVLNTPLPLPSNVILIQ